MIGFIFGVAHAAEPALGAADERGWSDGTAAAARHESASWRIEGFFDGAKVFEFCSTGASSAEWPFDNPHFLLINLAIGGSWGGVRGIDDAIFPLEFLVDYVRVWRAPVPQP